MHTTRRLTLTLLAAAVLGPGLALAQERGTREEAKAMVDAAIEHIRKVGADKALNDFTHDKSTWVKKDLYVFVFDDKGVFTAHGATDKLVGKDMSGVKDAKGQSLYEGQLAVARKGGGWYDYEWADPITRKIMPKSVYVRVPPSGVGYLGVGVYR